MLAVEAPRPRGGQRRAVARDAGHQCRAWARPSTSPSSGPGVAAARDPAGGVSAATIATAPARQPGRDRPRATEPPLDLALERVAGDRGRQERERDQRGAPGVEGGELLGDLAPLADQQRRRGAGVQRDLEALAGLGVDRVPIPPGEPRHAATGAPSSRPGAARSGPGPRPRAAARAGVEAGSVGGASAQPTTRRRPRAAAAADDQVDDPGDDRRADDVVEVLEVVAPVLPVVADLAPDQRQRRSPRGCSRAWSAP